MTQRGVLLGEVASAAPRHRASRANDGHIADDARLAAGQLLEVDVEALKQPAKQR